MKEKRNTGGKEEYPTDEGKAEYNHDFQEYGCRREKQARQRYFLPLDIGYSVLVIGYSFFM